MTIEKLAENFVRAASELEEATGVHHMMGTSSHMQMHMSEGQFNKIFEPDSIKTELSGGMDFPIELSIMVGGVKFFCLTKDWDTWAKLKGYVKRGTA